MEHHGFCPSTFICANIIPFFTDFSIKSFYQKKGLEANLSDSDKYRGIYT